MHCHLILSLYLLFAFSVHLYADTNDTSTPDSSLPKTNSSRKLSEIRKDLFNSLKNQNFKQTQDLLDKYNINLNYTDKYSYLSPLAFACYQCDTPTVAYLLSKGADIHYSRNHALLFDYKSIKNIQDEHDDNLEDDLNNKFAFNKLNSSFYPMHYACVKGNLEMVKFLETQGGSLFTYVSNERDEDDRSYRPSIPLYTALEKNHTHIVEYACDSHQALQHPLLFKNPPEITINPNNTTTETQLLFFSFGEHLNDVNAPTLKVLLKYGFDPNYKIFYNNFSSTSFLELNIIDMEMVKLLIEAGAKLDITTNVDERSNISFALSDQKKTSILHYAISKNADTEIIFLLMENGVRILEEDPTSYQLLRYAILQRYDIHFIRYLIEEKKIQTYIPDLPKEETSSVVVFLIENDFNRSVFDALYMACQQKDTELIRYLFKHEQAFAVENQKENFFQNRGLLHGLLSSRKDFTFYLGNFAEQRELTFKEQQAFVELFLANETVDINEQYQDRYTPFSVACQNENVDSALLQFLISKGALVNISSNKTTTLGLLAEKNVDTPIMELLIAHGAEVEPIDAPFPPLHYMCAKGECDIDNNRFSSFYFPTKTFNPVTTRRTIEYLISKGANVNKLDVKGYTPIYYAVKMGDVAAIKTLIENGAKRDILYNGNEALSQATENTFIHEILQNYTGDNPDTNNGATDFSNSEADWEF